MDNPSFEFWVKQVLTDWAVIGRREPQYEAAMFRQAFRMSKTAFKTLCNSYCTSLETKLRKAIPVENRLAIFLDWFWFFIPAPCTNL